MINRYLLFAFPRLHINILLLVVLSYLVYNLFFYTSNYGTYLGSRFPPTQGEVWPRAQHEIKENTFYTFSPAQFEINITNKKCKILEDAISRYVPRLEDLFTLGRQHWGKSFNKSGRHHDGRFNLSETKLLRQLQINLTQPCEEFPHLGMDESYNLTISTQGNLDSKSIWGILRGLETFAHLFYKSNDFSEVRINATRIVDYPRYPHRGLMLDTGRHYLSMASILKTLDAMAMNKMNVLHWHIVDDESFPYESEKFPELSEKGAFHSSMVYRKTDIATVVEYARVRGIRVVPEFDVPGHTISWGAAYPDLLVNCCTGVMDPTKNSTYELIRDLFSEVQEWFPDDHFHIGGDEVYRKCWTSNPHIKEYMKDHNITNAKQLFAMFIERVTPLLKKSTKIIAWQDVFDNEIRVAKDGLVHIWRNGYVEEMVKILKAGHRLLFSSMWYLDLIYSYTFDGMYTVDPRQEVKRKFQKSLPLENILGGEACMWGELIDDRNLLSTVWPRASAVAEVLWSPAQSASGVSAHTHRRIEEHACRMVRRGVPAGPPNGPGFCIAN